MLMYAGQCNQYAPGDDILALLPKDMPACEFACGFLVS